VKLEMSRWIVRELGLDPNDVIMGEEEANGSSSRDIRRFAGGDKQVKYVPMVGLYKCECS
jgi:hypothetical protein